MDLTNNRQEIFDRVVEHLLTQREKSTRTGRLSNNEPAYRGDHGRMCAVGILISDENYSVSLEGSTIHNTKVRDAVEASGYDLTDSDKLLYELQKIHDRISVFKWEESLRTLAKSYGLSLKTLNRFAS